MFPNLFGSVHASTRGVFEGLSNLGSSLTFTLDLSETRTHGTDRSPRRPPHAHPAPPPHARRCGSVDRARRRRCDGRAGVRRLELQRRHPPDGDLADQQRYRHQPADEHRPDGGPHREHPLSLQQLHGVCRFASHPQHGVVLRQLHKRLVRAVEQHPAGRDGQHREQLPDRDVHLRQPCPKSVTFTIDDIDRASTGQSAFADRVAIIPGTSASASGVGGADIMGSGTTGTAWQTTTETGALRGTPVRRRDHHRRIHVVLQVLDLHRTRQARRCGSGSATCRCALARDLTAVAEYRSLAVALHRCRSDATRTSFIIRGFVSAVLGLDCARCRPRSDQTSKVFAHWPSWSSSCSTQACR